MAPTETLLDPTGGADTAAAVTLAPRPASLRGLRVGLLDNTKANATALLTEIARLLEQRAGIGETRLYTKDYFGTPVKEELLEQIVRECDVVVTAIGDCGSCSAATVADGVAFERAGVPAVSITSDSFRMSGAAMARIQGFPGFEFAAARHPIASLESDELKERAEELMPEILPILGVEV